MQQKWYKRGAGEDAGRYGMRLARNIGTILLFAVFAVIVRSASADIEDLRRDRFIIAIFIYGLVFLIGRAAITHGTVADPLRWPTIQERLIAALQGSLLALAGAGLFSWVSYLIGVNTTSMLADIRDTPIYVALFAIGFAIFAPAVKSAKAG